jgi:hypothetical protein
VNVSVTEAHELDQRALARQLLSRPSCGARTADGHIGAGRREILLGYELLHWGARYGQTAEREITETLTLLPPWESGVPPIAEDLLA